MLQNNVTSMSQQGSFIEIWFEERSKIICFGLQRKNRLMGHLEISDARCTTAFLLIDDAVYHIEGILNFQKEKSRFSSIFATETGLRKQKVDFVYAEKEILFLSDCKLYRTTFCI